MAQWLGEYTIKIKEDKAAQTDSTETALSIVREQLTELQLQQDKICEYLEKGIYTIEMFTKRNDTLTREIHKVQAAENELLKKQGSQKDIHDVEKEIIPTTHSTFSTAIQNFLLKKKIVYGKLSWNGLQPTVHQMGKLAFTFILNFLCDKVYMNREQQHLDQRLLLWYNSILCHREGRLFYGRTEA